MSDVLTIIPERPSECYPYGPPFHHAEEIREEPRTMIPNVVPKRKPVDDDRSVSDLLRKIAEKGIPDNEVSILRSERSILRRNIKNSPKRKRSEKRVKRGGQAEDDSKTPDVSSVKPKQSILKNVEESRKPKPSGKPSRREGRAEKDLKTPNSRRKSRKQRAACPERTADCRYCTSHMLQLEEDPRSRRDEGCWSYGGRDSEGDSLFDRSERLVPERDHSHELLVRYDDQDPVESDETTESREEQCYTEAPLAIPVAIFFPPKFQVLAGNCKVNVVSSIFKVYLGIQIGGGFDPLLGRIWQEYTRLESERLQRLNELLDAQTVDSKEVKKKPTDPVRKIPFGSPAEGGGGGLNLGQILDLNALENSSPSKNTVPTRWASGRTYKRTVSRGRGKYRKKSGGYRKKSGQEVRRNRKALIRVEGLPYDPELADPCERTRNRFAVFKFVQQGNLGIPPRVMKIRVRDLPSLPTFPIILRFRKNNVPGNLFGASMEAGLSQECPRATVLTADSAKRFPGPLSAGFDLGQTFQCTEEHKPQVPVIRVQASSCDPSNAKKGTEDAKALEKIADLLEKIVPKIENSAPPPPHPTLGPILQTSRVFQSAPRLESLPVLIPERFVPQPAFNPSSKPQPLPVPVRIPTAQPIPSSPSVRGPIAQPIPSSPPRMRINSGYGCSPSPRTSQTSLCKVYSDENCEYYLCSSLSALSLSKREQLEDILEIRGFPSEKRLSTSFCGHVPASTEDFLGPGPHLFGVEDEGAWNHLSSVSPRQSPRAQLYLYDLFQRTSSPVTPPVTRSSGDTSSITEKTTLKCISSRSDSSDEQLVERINDYANLRREQISHFQSLKPRQSSSFTYAEKEEEYYKEDKRFLEYFFKQRRTESVRRMKGLNRPRERKARITEILADGPDGNVYGLLNPDVGKADGKVRIIFGPRDIATRDEKVQLHFHLDGKVYGELRASMSSLTRSIYGNRRDSLMTGNSPEALSVDETQAETKKVSEPERMNPGSESVEREWIERYKAVEEQPTKSSGTALPIFLLRPAVEAGAENCPEQDNNTYNVYDVSVLGYRKYDFPACIPPRLTKSEKLDLIKQKPELCYTKFVHDFEKDAEDPRPSGRKLRRLISFEEPVERRLFGSHEDSLNSRFSMDGVDRHGWAWFVLDPDARASVSEEGPVPRIRNRKKDHEVIVAHVPPGTPTVSTSSKSSDKRRRLKVTKTKSRLRHKREKKRANAVGVTKKQPDRGGAVHETRHEHHHRKRHVKDGSSVSELRHRHRHKQHRQRSSLSQTVVRKRSGKMKSRKKKEQEGSFEEVNGVKIRFKESDTRIPSVSIGLETEHQPLFTSNRPELSKFLDDKQIKGVFPDGTFWCSMCLRGSEIFGPRSKRPHRGAGEYRVHPLPAAQRTDDLPVVKPPEEVRIRPKPGKLVPILSRRAGMMFLALGDRQIEQPDVVLKGYDGETDGETDELPSDVLSSSQQGNAVSLRREEERVGHHSIAQV
ncbi:unnamed protein product [Cyprideis torosa]|uniref:Uncharacterized protein n=1 Tax=Cyprideis torosa TaxID=163714 RepID=A0A7R8W6L6_9CRUS|nr:unnamed protein product [Cyprideis torosa]CAG0885357.1 unnamed protein product [Cyprideis torosa]